MIIKTIAAFGCGSIIASFIVWRGSKAVAISNHRQDWINSLRDDLVLFLKQVDVLNFIIKKNGYNETKTYDARNDAMLAYRRVLMRLNMVEEDHKQLVEKLDALMKIGTGDVDPKQMADVINQSRIVLKREWAVTKYGLATNMILRWKSIWRVFRKTGEANLMMKRFGNALYWASWLGFIFEIAWAGISAAGLSYQSKDFVATLAFAAVILAGGWSLRYIITGKMNPNPFQT